MKMVVSVDTNILLRYFLQDHSTLSLKAKNIFIQAQQGKIIIYIDEVILAETIWALSTYYKTTKSRVVEKVSKLLYLPWISNPRKNLINKALKLYFNSTKLSYVDCWLYVLSLEEKMKLETFDKNLQKLKKS